jgi:hypothetical protein
MGPGEKEIEIEVQEEVTEITEVTEEGNEE